METCTTTETAGSFPLPRSLHFGFSVTAAKSPCEIALDNAEALNRQNGHENAGFLSRSAGFMPLEQPLTTLPDTFQVWDELALSLPRLLKQRSLRAAADRMPVLSACPEHLPAVYLRRASMVISILAHAYMNIHDEAGSTTLPESIERPWTEISRRLGHDEPFLSYIDLIVYNWQSLSGETNAEALHLKNMRLLLPTVDNHEESVFYLAQTEIVAHSTPLINNIVAAQRAVLARDTASLTRTLCKMTGSVHKIARLSLNSISSRSSNSRRVDPVVWAKTVAPLAAPLRPTVQGPGGIANPFFHMMDAFIGRENYNSFLGREMQKIQQTYPLHWRVFLKAVRDVSIPAYVAKTRDAALDAAWAVLQETYYGQEGLLGLHRRKVYAYSIVAFKAGRTATTADVKGGKGEDGWMKVQRELEQSRQERFRSSDPAGADSSTLKSNSSSGCGEPKTKYRISELARHCRADQGYWFAAKGHVYNVTSYMRIHPGGDKILANSAGRDVTADLHAVSHFQIPSIRAKLDKYIIGELHVQTFSDTRIQNAYDYAVALVYRILDSQTTYQNDVTFLDRQLTSADGIDELTPQKLHLLSAAQAQIHVHHIPTLASHLLAVARELLHDRHSLTVLADLADSMELFGKDSPRHPSSTWDGVRAAVNDTVSIFDFLRTKAIDLLALLEDFAEGSTAFFDASENVMVAIMDRLAQTASRQ